MNRLLPAFAGAVLAATALAGGTAAAHTHHPGPMSKYVRVWNWGTFDGHEHCWAWINHASDDVAVECADGYTTLVQ